MVLSTREIELMRNFRVNNQLRETAAFFHRSPVTIRKYTTRAPPPRPKPSRANQRIRTRRERVATIARETTRVGHLEFPTYGSAKAISFCLKRKHKICISARTVTRDLRTSGFVSLVRRPVPTRSAADAAKRKAFAKEWAKRSAKRLIFVDEAWISCNENSGRQMWVDRSKNRRARPLPLERRNRFNVASVQVFGAVGWNYKSKLVILPRTHNHGEESAKWTLNGSGYIQRCLSKISKDLASPRVLLQDGSRAHCNKVVKAYLQRKSIQEAAGYPPNSPDYNIIEMIWSTLKRGIGSRAPLTLAQLQHAATEAWNAIPQRIINNHVRHFERLMKAEANL